MNTIYMIMTSTKLEVSKTGFPDFGSSNIVGWYDNLEDAQSAVTSNACDLWETVYDYVLIEESEMGLYPCSMTRWFYKYNLEKNQYEEIKEPKEFRVFCGFIV